MRRGPKSHLSRKHLAPFRFLQSQRAARLLFSVGDGRINAFGPLRARPRQRLCAPDARTTPEMANSDVDKPFLRPRIGGRGGQAPPERAPTFRRALAVRIQQQFKRAASGFERPAGRGTVEILRRRTCASRHRTRGGVW
jgi:hypothetical protein